MNIIDFKIALRTFIKGKWYNFLNIGGLALGLAAFIFVTLYVGNETSYDKWNKNINHIFLVEREMPTGPSAYTPGKLAAAIKSQCPEIEEIGRTNTALFPITFYTSSGKFPIKKAVGADYSIAKILGIKPKGFNLNPRNITPTILLSKGTANRLFPRNTSVQNKTVYLMSKKEMPMTIAGVADDAPGNTNLDFDYIGFVEDITSGKDQSYANQIYQTYILVKPNTDINLLSKKIGKIYKEAAMADSSQVAKEALKRAGAAIYLDPLDNLHLKPHYGSPVNNQIVKGLIVLSLIILIITGVNFTNLYISQAYKRAKEVGIKKVNGIVKRQIAIQFLAEIFIQCLVALIVSIGIVILGLPYFNQLLQVKLLVSGINFHIVVQLFFTLVSITLIAGIYPAIIMAGFKPAEVLGGNQFANGWKFSWIQNSIIVFQFTFAIVFMITLIIINQQVTFMKTQDPGFQAKQVVYIDNQTLFNNPKKFQSLRERIKAVPGVKNVTVASNVPGGIIPASYEYAFQDKAFAINTIGVDYEYFETLNIKLKEGRSFSLPSPADSGNAVINESAAKAIGLIKDPIGKMITGRKTNYRIIGVIKDVKDNGFEENVKPTIYLLNYDFWMPKTQILIGVEISSIPVMLTTLKHEWSDINKLDGENFNYHFLDELYGQLFVKQEQLQTVLVSFSILAIFIASIGLFSSAAYAIQLRTKEIAIRKVVGAKAEQLMATLSKPFFYTVLIANVTAWPVSILIANRWLATFAYRIHLSINPFITALAISVCIVAITVCLQTIKAVKVNPTEKLKT